MKIEIDNYNINYEIDGYGQEVIVILQGWGTTLQVYNSMAKLLSTKYKVVRLDLPGFGSSDEPRSAWSVEDYADFFLKFLAKLKLEEVILIGHSYGGRIIIKLASRGIKPIKISKIVLIDSAGVLPKKTAKQKLKIYRYRILKKVMKLKIINKIFSSFVENWKNRQGSDDYRNASPIMRQCLVKAVNEDLSNILKEIKTETLLIWGENDIATPLSDAKLMEREIPNSGLAIIKNAGHYCFLEQPTVFNSILTSYFKL